MPAPDSLTQNYRFLALLFEGSNTIVYLAERKPASSEKGPVTLILWQRAPFVGEKGEREFEESTRVVASKYGFVLLDYGIEKALPYVVLSYKAEQKEVLTRYIDDVEQSVQAEATQRLPADGSAGASDEAVQWQIGAVSQNEGGTISDAPTVRSLEEMPPSVADADAVTVVSDGETGAGGQGTVANEPTVQVEEKARQSASGEATVLAKDVSVPPTVRSEQYGQYPPVAPSTPSSPGYPPMPSNPGYPPYQSGEYVAGAQRTTGQPRGYVTEPQPPVSYPGACGSGSGAGYYSPYPSAYPSTPSSRVPAQPRPRKPMPRWVLRAALIVAILIVLLGAVMGYIFLPVSAAQIDITPQTRHLSKSYNVYTSSTQARSDSAGGVVQTDTLTLTTDTKTATAPATGKGQKGAATATGQVVLSQATITSGASSLYVPGVNIDMGNGESFIISTGFTVQSAAGWSLTLNASAGSAGTHGNFSAGLVDGLYDIYDRTTGATEVTLYISNLNAFSGGADNHDYSYVTQQDITNTQNTLQKQLNNDGKTQILKQIMSSEKQLGDVTCTFTPDSSKSSSVNDETNQVKLAGFSNCYVTVVKMQNVQDVAKNLQAKEIASQYGATYDAMSDTSMSDPKAVKVVDGQEYTVTVDGWWVYHVDARQLAQKLTGKTQWQASDLLKGNSSIKSFTLSPSGLGGSMPSSADSIKIVVEEAKET